MSDGHPGPPAGRQADRARRPPVPLLSGAAVLLVLLAAAWLLRFRIADRVVERRLAAAGVPASYRLTRLGPFEERIEDVRIGDPAAPDLTADRIDVVLGYTLAGPVVRGVRARGVRLRGRIGGGQVRFGALDRLLPRTGAAARLPDLDLALRDARLVLATPGGTIHATLDGAGNPQGAFRGRMRLAAPSIRIAACRAAGLRADLRATARDGAPAVAGNAIVAGLACPGVAIGAGTLRLAARSDPAFQRFAVDAAPAGFGGQAYGIRFAAVTGTIAGGGRADVLAVTTRLAVAGLSIPRAARTVQGIAVPPGMPVTPTLRRAQAATARLLADADADIAAGIGMARGVPHVELRRLALRGDDGAHVVAVPRGGIGWAARGLRLDGDVVADGGALPTAAVALRQAGAAAPIDGTLRVDRYAAAGAALAIPATRFRWTGRRLTIDGRIRVDGPLADGVVRGLDLPVRGWVDRTGALAFGAGCQRIAAASMRLAAVTFAPVGLPICGAPVVARRADGTWRLDAATGPILLRGRTGNGTLVSIAAAGVRVDGGGVDVRGLQAAAGNGPHPTTLSVARLAGRPEGGAIGGTLADASARIGAVPLTLDRIGGSWRLAGGVLHVAGGLQVGDAAGAPRFRPLEATDARLALRDGAIAAAAILREPASRAAVARVTIRHDLANGDGNARLVIDGLRFVPKGLQPDMLTPLTLGVIANVAGVVTGEGRIAWDARGVTSSGRFGTDRLDLAAAFGPVTGVQGRIDFTDLLGLKSAPGQVARVAAINPGIAIPDGEVRFHLPGDNRVAVESARWPFAGGTLRLEPATIDLSADRERRLTFRLDALDAGAFVQQLALPNVSATGTFDGVLPMVFGPTGGRIERGTIAARPPGGTIAYVGELTSAKLGTMGKLAFDALKAIRYSNLTIDLDGQLDGEMVSRVRFTGVREATPGQSLVTRLIRGLPFRFNIAVRAPFRGLVGTARTYADPSLLLRQVPPAAAAPATDAAVQPAASGAVR